MSTRYDASFDEDQSFDERPKAPQVRMGSQPQPSISEILKKPLTQYQGASDFYRNVFLPFIVSTQEHFNKQAPTIATSASPDKRHTVYSASKG
jgi:hypothetical protein